MGSNHYILSKKDITEKRFFLFKSILFLLLTVLFAVLSIVIKNIIIRLAMLVLLVVCFIICISNFIGFKKRTNAFFEKRAAEKLKAKIGSAKSEYEKRTSDVAAIKNNYVIADQALRNKTGNGIDEFSRLAKEQSYNIYKTSNQPTNRSVYVYKWDNYVCISGIQLKELCQLKKALDKIENENDFSLLVETYDAYIEMGWGYGDMFKFGTNKAGVLTEDPENDFLIAVTIDELIVYELIGHETLVFPNLKITSIMVKPSNSGQFSYAGENLSDFLSKGNPEVKGYWYYKNNETVFEYVQEYYKK